MMNTTTDLSYTSQGWFTHTRRRLHSMNAQLWIEHQWSPPLQRQEDTSLVQSISQLSYVTTTIKTKCNMCRFYLRIVTIADLAHEDGKHIPANRMTGNWRATSTLTMWPIFDRLPKPFWTIFRKCIRDAYGQTRAFCRNTRGHAKQKIELAQPLQAWLPVERHIAYQSFRSQPHLFLKDSNNRCWRYKPSTTVNAHVLDRECEIPSNTHPISARTENGEMWTTQTYHFLPPLYKINKSLIRHIEQHPRRNMAG